MRDWSPPDLGVDTLHIDGEGRKEGREIPTHSNFLETPDGGFPFTISKQWCLGRQGEDAGIYLRLGIITMTSNR